jgi:hypothetical protein
VRHPIKGLLHLGKTPTKYLGWANFLRMVCYIKRSNITGLDVTSRTVVWLFVEQFWFEFVPVLHRLQGRLAAQG